ncbi:hypothetical protein D3C78_799090 [compost metagenome]
MVDDIAVVPRAPLHDIGTRTAIEPVVARVTNQQVVQLVAGGVDGCSAGQGEVFDIGRERVTYRTAHAVQSFARLLDHHIRNGVDDVAVVAGTSHQGIRALAAIQGVVASQAVQDVVAVVADQDVVRLVAGTREMTTAGEFEVFQAVDQLIVDGGLDGIDTLAGQLDHLVGCIVDHVGIVAATADQHIRTGAAIEDIVTFQAHQHVGAGVALEHVVQRVARAVDGGSAGQGEVFQILAQGPGHAALDGIDAAIDLLDDTVPGTLDHIGVIAPQACQDVVQFVADQHVVQLVARTGNGGAGKGQVLEIGAQHIVEGADDSIRTLPGMLENRVAEVIQNIGIVTMAAGHAVRPQATVQHVAATVADQYVVLLVAGAIDGGTAGQLEVFQMSAKAIGDRGADGIVALALVLDDLIPDVVDPVDVVAHTADQGIRPLAAIQHIVAGQTVQGVGCIVAGDGVVQLVTGAVDARSPGQGEILDRRSQGVGDARLDGVDALARVLDHDVGQVVDHVGIVALPTYEQVGTAAAIQPVIPLATQQRVVARAAFQHVVSGFSRQQVVAGIAGDDVGQLVTRTAQVSLAGQHQVLQMGTQGVVDGALDGVLALVGQLAHAVAETVHHVGVVTDTTEHGVVAGTAIQQVVAVIADQGVVALQAQQTVVAVIADHLVVERIAGAVEVGCAQQAEIF